MLHSLTSEVAWLLVSRSTVDIGILEIGTIDGISLETEYIYIIAINFIET